MVNVTQGNFKEAIKFIQSYEEFTMADIQKIETALSVFCGYNKEV